MAEIKAFKGYRYNLEKVEDLSEVITPPYDVIDNEAQDKFYQVNPFNFIRLELGKKDGDDSNSNNVYTRARDTFAAWVKEEILIQETKPALYLYQQEFQINNITYVRTGFITGLKAEDYSCGQVLPHEETLPKHKADRLELMRTTQANFSPIFGLYSDPENAVYQTMLRSVEGKQPDIEVTDWAKEKHRLWVITDEKVIEKVTAIIKDKKIYIADGHHRYETAVNFAKEMSEKGQEGYDHIMITLVNLFDQGLVVLPTHRLVKNVADFNFDRFLNSTKEYFDVTRIPESDSRQNTLELLLNRMAESGETGHIFGLYGGKDKLYIIKLKSSVNLEEINGADKSAAWRNLDVTVLHGLVLEKLLGIGEKERASEGFLSYTRDDLYAMEAVDQGEFQFSLLMNAPKVEEVTEVAGAGEKMPQKSTFFYPKVISGLVINKLG